MSSRFNGQIFVKDLIAEPGATGTKLDYQNSTNPEYIGPGTWNIIHRMSFRARSHDEQRAFVKFMWEICNGFPCPVCARHCTEYTKNHPIESYLDILVDINGERLPLGLFVWTWKFHNAVNARLKKPIMGWNTAFSLYSGEEPMICSKTCDTSQKSRHEDDSNNNHPGFTSLPNPGYGANSRTFHLIPINRDRSRRIR